MFEQMQAEEQTVGQEAHSGAGQDWWTGGNGANPFLSEDFLNNWRSLIESFMDGKTNGGQEKRAAETETIERMINANGFFVLLNKFWEETLKELPKLYEVKKNQDEAQNLMDGWLARYQELFKDDSGMLLTGELEQIINTWTNLLQIHTNSAGRILNPWMESMSDWGEVSEKIAQGDLSALDKGYHLWLNTYNDTIGRVLKMPALGLTKQHAEKLKRVHAEFTQFSSSLPFFHQYIYQTGISAMKEVFDKIQNSELDKPSPENLKEIYNIWLATNEKAFFKLFQRPDFCTTTSEVLHSFLRVKRQLDDLTATWCTAMSIPTNQDHDKMAMSIQELKRRVREQQRAIEALQEKLEAISK